MAVSDDVASQHLDAAAARVERQGADDQAFGKERLAATPDQRAQPGEQFAEVERLDQVVVGAAIESGDARLDGVARRHHQDGHGASRLADGAAHGEAVLAGKHHVKDDRVVVGGGDLEDGRVAVGGQVDGVRLLAKPLREQVGGVRLVFNQENPHLVAPIRWVDPVAVAISSSRASEP